MSEERKQQKQQRKKSGGYAQRQSRTDRPRTAPKKPMQGAAVKPKKESAKSVCTVFDRCGGCQYSGMPYAAQLEKKQKAQEKLLSAFGKVYPIMGMERPEGYRNKVIAALGRKKDGTVISGTYEENSHRIVPIDTCALEDPRADQIICDIRRLLQSFKIQIFNENSGYGLMRHILVRVGKKSGQILVVLVAVSPVMPSKNNFVKALRKMHPEITSIVLNINDRQTSMVLGKRDIVLYGKGYIEDELCGLNFRISPQSFYQINPVQTEKLYGKAIELAGLDGHQRIIDAYCGIGTIGLIAAKHAKEVIGVELNPEAVRDARSNMKANGIKNASIYAADAGEFITDMAMDGEKADVLFMDPPRSGSTQIFMDSACRLAPKKIVYISCEPTTLARDLQYLTKKGYRCEQIHSVDMFPATEKIETVVLLSQKSGQ